MKGDPIKTHARFRALWERNERVVRRMCRRAARRQTVCADDLVQCVALRLIECCDKLHHDVKPRVERAWVRRVADSVIARLLEEAPERYVQLTEPLADDDREGVAVHDVGIADVLGVLRPGKALIERGIDGDPRGEVRAVLDDDDRALLQMKLDGFNNDDLAMLTGLSYAAAATRLHRIRRRMAEYARKLHYIE